MDRVNSSEIQIDMTQPTAPSTTVFRLSPLATWAKVLDRKPGIDHYAITGTDPQLGGSATLQRFERVVVDGRAAVPLLAHSHVYPLARGGQFAGYTARAFWFDGATGGLMGTCAYSDNREGRAFYNGMGPWDWTVNDADAMSLPPRPVTVNFAVTDLFFSTAWVPCRYAMGEMGSTGQGSAYARGGVYTLPGVTVERRTTVETAGQPGLAIYRFQTRTSLEGSEPVVDSVAFWVHISQYYIQHVECELSVVSVDPETREHRWLEQATRWNRLG